MIDIDSLRAYYHGFFLSGPVGNNAFSYEDRETQSLYIPPIMAGGLDDLSVGIGTAFSEMRDGKEIDAVGLNDFVYMPWGGKDVFIFDNHNHAFFFWNYEVMMGRVARGLTLLHVDQHRDMRDASVPFTGGDDLARIFDYTNFVLDVGNFIKPALDLKIFSHVETVSSSDDFQKNFTAPFVFDLDMDIFSPEMDYIPHAIKMECVRAGLQAASAVTIATSPYFIDQEKALMNIRGIFN